MAARLAELRRLADRERIAQSGAGVLAIDGTAVGAHSVFVGGDVYGHIYHMYQSAPGRKALRQQDVERILGDYLRWVDNAYSKARLYGLESSPTARGRPVRSLATGAWARLVGTARRAEAAHARWNKNNR